MRCSCANVQQDKRVTCAVYVFSDEAELVARALGCRLMRASVKEDVNVGAVFRALAARCLADLRRDDADPALPPAAPPVIGTHTSSTYYRWSILTFRCHTRASLMLLLYQKHVK